MALRKRKTDTPKAPATAPADQAAPAQVDPEAPATPEGVDEAFGMTKAETYGKPAKAAPTRGYDYDRGF